MSTIPPDFTLPPHALDVAGAVKKQIYVVAQLGVEDLEDARIASDQAATVIVHLLMEQACTMAMAIAVAEGRSPQKARWQETTSHLFDQTLERFRPIIDGRDRA